MRAMPLSEMTIIVPTNAAAIVDIKRQLLADSESDVIVAKSISDAADLILTLVQRVQVLEERMEGNDKVHIAMAERSIRLEGYIEGHDMRHTAMAEEEWEAQRKRDEAIGKADGSGRSGLPGLTPKAKTDAEDRNRL